MGMFSFEGLIVYKKAFEANQKVYRLLKENRVIPLYVKNQLGRASLSIMLNIAEGSAKFGDRDRRNFYITARVLYLNALHLSISYTWKMKLLL
jgi:hypothetical protein